MKSVLAVYERGATLEGGASSDGDKLSAVRADGEPKTPGGGGRGAELLWSDLPESETLVASLLSATLFASSIPAPLRSASEGRPLPPTGGKLPRRPNLGRPPLTGGSGNPASEDELDAPTSGCSDDGDTLRAGARTGVAGVGSGGGDDAEALAAVPLSSGSGSAVSAMILSSVYPMTRISLAKVDRSELNGDLLALS